MIRTWWNSPPRAGDSWSAEEMQWVRDKLRSGWTTELVAQHVMRTHTAISLKVAQIDNELRTLLDCDLYKKDIPLISDSVQYRLLEKNYNVLMEERKKLQEELRAVNKLVKSQNVSEPAHSVYTVPTELNVQSGTDDCKRYGIWILVAIVYVVTVLALTQ